MYEIGWTEANLVQIIDPEHIWFDPTGPHFHLLLRAHTGSTNLACLAKVVESPDQSELTVDLQKSTQANRCSIFRSLVDKCGSTSFMMNRPNSTG